MPKKANKFNKSRTREIRQGVTYHTYSRLINREPLMEEKAMKYLMEDVIAMTQEKYNFEFNTYTILDNHFHFLITTLENEATISTIMQFIKSQFAQRYNKMMNRSGPVWNERFGHTIIENADNPFFYFNWVSLYIFYNPVKAGYVKDPRDYAFSCMRFYLEENYQPKLKLTFNKYFLNLGENFNDRVEKFLAFEELYVFYQKHKNFIFAWLLSIDFHTSS